MMDRIADLEDKILDLEEIIDEELLFLEDELVGSVDDQMKIIDELTARLEDLEDHHIEDVLDVIQEEGLHIGSRWVIDENADGDLEFDDTSSFRSRFTFARGTSKTFDGKH